MTARLDAKTVLARIRAKMEAHAARELDEEDQMPSTRFNVDEYDGYGRTMLNSLRLLYQQNEDALWFIEKFETTDTIRRPYAHFAYTLREQDNYHPLRHLIALFCRATLPNFSEEQCDDSDHFQKIAEFLDRLCPEAWTWQPTRFGWWECINDGDVGWRVETVRFPIPLTCSSYILLKLR